MNLLKLFKRENPVNTPIQLKWVKLLQNKWKQKILKPTYVQWICTHKCNFRCAHCGTAAGEERAGELKTEEIIKAVDVLAELGCEIFSVTGGEALLRKDIFEVLAYVKNKGIMAGFVTNGYATEEYLPQLEKIKLDSILVSIDGYGKKHEEVRGVKGSYEKCLKSLEIYRKLGVRRIAVSTVMLKENIDDIPKIIEDVWKHGCNKQRIQPLIPEGRAKGTKNDPDVVNKAFRIILEARKKGIDIDLSEGFGYLGGLEPKVRSFNFFCGCGWNTFTIMHNGDVMGCPALDFPELREGNIREKDLKDIWWNGFSKFRKTVLKDLPPKCKSCKYKEICRGGCWLFRANRVDPCFLEEAEKIALSF